MRTKIKAKFANESLRQTYGRGRAGASNDMKQMTSERERKKMGNREVVTEMPGAQETI